MRLKQLHFEQLNSPLLSTDAKAMLRCDFAKQLAEAGNYEEAAEAMGDLWRGVGQRPSLYGLDTRTRAEVLFRAGVLTGWLGSAGQIAGSQESAKDLISESLTLFSELSESGKVSEAYTELALCYWRGNELDEARTLLAEALNRAETNEQHTRALLNQSLIENSASRYDSVLRILDDNAHLFGDDCSPASRARFHGQRGFALKRLGESEQLPDYTDRAFIEYEAASVFAGQAGNIQYQARVENNLGSMYLQYKRFDEAHKHLDRARRLFVKLGERGSVAQVDDTRAKTLLNEGRNSDAAFIARSTVRSLEAGGESGLLAEALVTLATAEARLGRHEDARQVYERAWSVLDQCGDREESGRARLSLIEELEIILKPDELYEIYRAADERLSATRHVETLHRLRACASGVLEAIHQSLGTVPRADLRLDRPLDEQVLDYERELIRRALAASQGSITAAARYLGLSHQGLDFILKGRHKDLLSERKPARVRRKSIMKKTKR